MVKGVERAVVLGKLMTNFSIRETFRSVANKKTINVNIPWYGLRESFYCLRLGLARLESAWNLPGI